jgi:hypothetical protein
MDDSIQSPDDIAIMRFDDENATVGMVIDTARAKTGFEEVKIKFGYPSQYLDMENVDVLARDAGILNVIVTVQEDCNPRKRFLSSSPFQDIIASPVDKNEATGENMDNLPPKKKAKKGPGPARQGRPRKESPLKFAVESAENDGRAAPSFQPPTKPPKFKGMAPKELLGELSVPAPELGGTFSETLHCWHS